MKADSMAMLYAGHDLKDPDALAEKLVAGLHTDVEKFMAIFRWITDNIAYDVPLFLKGEKIDAKFFRKKIKLAAKKATFSKKVYAHTLRRKSSICSGYSMLLEYMSNHVGIECNIVNGYARDGTQRIGSGKVNHAWNVVRLGQKWYVCDATWASGYVNIDARKFFRDFSETYFLTDPSLFIANHYPVDASWCLLYEKPSLKEFLNAPVKFKGFILNRINFYAPASGVIKKALGDTVRFEFTSNLETLGKAYLSCHTNPKLRETINYDLKQNEEGKYFFEYILKDAGLLKLQIVIDHRLTFRYDVYVARNALTMTP